MSPVTLAGQDASNIVQHVWRFRSGAELIFEFGAEKDSVFLKANAESAAVLVSSGWIASVPYQGSSVALPPKLISRVALHQADSSRLVHFQMNFGSHDEVFVLDDQGHRRVLRLEGQEGPERVYERIMDLSSNQLYFDKKDWLVVSVQGEKHAGLTVLFADDGGTLLLEEAFRNLADQQLAFNEDEKGRLVPALIAKAALPLDAPAPSSGSKLIMPRKGMLEIDWSFKDGSKLVFELDHLAGASAQDNVYFESRTGERKLLRSGRVEVFPSPFEQNMGRIKAVEVKPHRLSVIQIDRKLHVALDSGKLVELPVDYAGLPSSPWIVRSTANVEHKGREYLLVSLSTMEAGETFIMRDDGKHFRVDYMPFDLELSRVRVKDGIVSWDDAIRAIDLDRFDMEATIKVKPLQLVDGYDPQTGKDAKRNPFDILQGTLPDIRRELRGVDTSDAELYREQKDLIVRSLKKRYRNNVVVLGEAGVGKTDLIYQTLAEIAQGKTDIPRTWGIRKMSATALGAGGRYRGDTEAKVEAIKAVNAAVPTLWFTDEIHTLRGQGSASDNPNDILDWIKESMSRGGFRGVGTSTNYEFFEQEGAIGNDPALAERMNIMQFQGPRDEAETIKVVRNFIRREGWTAPDDVVLRKLIRLTSEYNATANQPRSATDVLDLIYEGHDEGWIPSESDVIDGVKKVRQLDPALFDHAQMRQRVRGLRPRLDSKVAGLDLAKDKIEEQAKIAYSGTASQRRPQIAMLIAGAPGGGKTELAKVMAEALGVPAEIFEMNQHGPHTDPIDFLNRARDALTKNEFTALILDEIEKAHKDVQNAVLAMLNDGKFKVPGHKGKRGGIVSAKKAIVIATTNAGQEFIEQFLAAQRRSTKRLGFVTGPEQVVVQEGARVFGEAEMQMLRVALVHDGISQPLVDRFPYVVPAPSSTRDQFKAVIQIHLRLALSEISTSREATVRITNEAEYVEAMTARYYRPGQSNRIVHSIINQFRAEFADSIFDKGDDFRLDGKVIDVTYRPAGSQKFLIEEVVTPLLAECEAKLLPKKNKNTGN